MKTKKIIRVEKDLTVSEPPTTSMATPSEENVRQRAYEQWQAAGCPEGDGVGFWLEAEREIASQATPGANSKA